jgi:hypothetical protein
MEKRMVNTMAASQDATTTTEEKGNCRPGMLESFYVILPCFFQRRWFWNIDPRECTTKTRLEKIFHNIADLKNVHRCSSFSSQCHFDLIQVGCTYLPHHKLDFKLLLNTQFNIQYCFHVIEGGYNFF